MGGEHAPDDAPRAAGLGSSPHGRGTLHVPDAHRPRHRVIPAWAGNTLPPLAPDPTPGGHPRMGGEHRFGLPPDPWAGGSSPHGRGTRCDTSAGGGIGRVIPAWAGNTRAPGTCTASTAGHPRMGGEHRPPAGNFRVGAGSSPHGRGTRSYPTSYWQTRRVIPAWAGNTRAPWGWRPWRAGHPRMGGEHDDDLALQVAQGGSSPHGRGTPCRR